MSPFLRDAHRCQCTRGFFILRPCEAQAPNSCPRCQRWICSEHWYAGGPAPCCVECAARANEARHAYDDSTLWFHSYRHDYYTGSGYRPVYDGYVTAGIGTYYDPYDLRGFDGAAPGAAADFEDDGAGGLGDS